jgi:hypothetical protein
MRFQLPFWVAQGTTTMTSMDAADDVVEWWTICYRVYAYVVGIEISFFDRLYYSLVVCILRTRTNRPSC